MIDETAAGASSEERLAPRGEVLQRRASPAAAGTAEAPPRHERPDPRLRVRRSCSGAGPGIHRLS